VQQRTLSKWVVEHPFADTWDRRVEILRSGDKRESVRNNIFPNAHMGVHRSVLSAQQQQQQQRAARSVLETCWRALQTW